MKRVLAALVLLVMCAPPAHADPEPHGEPQIGDDFAITSEVPTLAELDAQIRLLVATHAPMPSRPPTRGRAAAVIVPKMIYRIGFFRPPRGTEHGHRSETHEPDRHTAVINASRQGAPAVQVTMPARIDGGGNWRADRCSNGVKTIGLPIPATEWIQTREDSTKSSTPTAVENVTVTFPAGTVTALPAR